MLPMALVIADWSGKGQWVQVANQQPHPETVSDRLSTLSRGTGSAQLLRHPDFDTTEPNELERLYPSSPSQRLYHKSIL
jgi:hypothetical protein